MLVYDPTLPLSCLSTEIDQMLLQLEEKVVTDNEGVVGPFTAFEVCDYTSAQVTIDADHTEDSDSIATDSIHLFDPASPAPSNLSLYIDAVAAELMHNYIHAVSYVLQPVDHPKNPYRSIYVPRAIAAGRIVVGIGDNPSHSGAALSHALLAVSACHLYRKQPENQHYGKLATLHRIEAVSNLKNALSAGEGTSHRFTTLSAMLSLLMEGGFTEFWIHLDGCEKLKSSLQSLPDNSSQYTQLTSICSFMHTLSQSTAPYTTPKLSLKACDRLEDLRNHSPFLPDNHSLEFTYGITATLASYLHLTISLPQNIAYFELNGLPTPPYLLKACIALYTAINSWSIDQESLASLPETDYETRSLITCHVIAFHAAIVIYFHTMLSHPTPLSTLQSYNKICASNLLAAEALKSSDGASKGWNAMAPIVWPGFIASCEAELIDRPLWQAWWTGVQKYCIGSIKTLWDVVQEVWRERDAGLVQKPGWREVLRRRGKRVMSGG
ncbi:fungal-specific transcription factor domain-containing protein [Aspergillus floccosus]